MLPSSIIRRIAGKGKIALLPVVNRYVFYSKSRLQNNPTGPGLADDHDSMFQADGSRNYGHSLSDISANELFDSIDKDRSGNISKVEFEEAIDRLSNQDVRKYIKLAFRAIDVDSSNTISKMEFKRAIGVLAHSELEFLKKGFSRNELSRTESTSTDTSTEKSFPNLLVNRFITTAEVCVSKILPAGFGWQAGALFAGSLGYGSTDVSLWLAAGVGDAIGVGLGHFSYYALKNVWFKQDLTAQAHTSVLLSTACIFSGTAWQPIFNFLHETAHLGFDGTAAGVVVGCSFAFFTGLRFGRLLWCGSLSGVAPASYANLKADALLGIAVGGATGAFVGTDVSFSDPNLGTDSNWLRPVVGIEEGTSAINAMVTAGASTALGFTATQTIQNITVPPGKNWVD